MMASKNKGIKKINVKALIALNLSLFLFLIIVLLSFAYSWIFKTYFSNIQGINIGLVESQGLIMYIDGTSTEAIDINTYLGETFSTFTLKEASSHNGRDIFLRESGDYYWGDNTYDGFDVARDNTGIIKLKPAVEQDHNVNFLYFSFVLQASGENRYLVFDDEKSFIKNEEGNPNYPVRVSITFGDTFDGNTVIVGNRTEFNGNFGTKSVEYIDPDTKVGITSGQTSGTFSDYSGYDEHSVFNPSRTLYYLEETTPINVTVRIWLEGGDLLCVDDIAATLLDISLHFDNIAESEVLNDWA